MYYDRKTPSKNKIRAVGWKDRKDMNDAMSVNPVF
jgi:hypothetical protein